MGVRCAELLIEDVIAGSALRDFMGRLPPNVVLVFFCWGGGGGATAWRMRSVDFGSSNKAHHNSIRNVYMCSWEKRASRVRHFEV